MSDEYLPVIAERLRLIIGRIEDLETALGVIDRGSSAY